MSDYSQLTHAELLRLRDNNPEPWMQEVLAPLEHRAFAREETKANPLMALPIAAGIPAYALAKALRLMDSRTRPSLDQVLAGYHGIWEGLRANKK